MYYIVFAYKGLIQLFIIITQTEVSVFIASTYTATRQLHSMYGPAKYSDLFIYVVVHVCVGSGGKQQEKQKKSSKITQKDNI